MNRQKNQQPEASDVHRLLQQMHRETLSSSCIFTSYLHAGVLSEWLGDHILHGKIVVPGAALLELCCAAALRASGTNTNASGVEHKVVVEGFSIQVPLVATDVRVQDGSGVDATRIWCVVEADGAVSVHSDVDGDRVLHAEGVVRIVSGAGSASNDGQPDWAALSRAAADAGDAGGKCSEGVDVQQLYDSFRSAGLPYGPTFRLMKSGRAAVDGSSSLMTLSVGHESLRTSTTLSPPLIDAILQCSAAGSQSPTSADQSKTMVPFSFDRVWLRPGALDSLWSEKHCIAHTEVRSVSTDMVVSDCTLLSASGEVVLRIEGMHARSISADGVSAEAPAAPSTHLEVGRVSSFLYSVDILCSIQCSMRQLETININITTILYSTL